jgi:hypothetical protein
MSNPLHEVLERERVQEANFHDVGIERKDSSPMRMYIFKSETTKDLRAFAGDPAGAKLPGNHAPWTATGIVRADEPPPHTLSRETIERAIQAEGFQLWRLRRKA